MFFFNFEDFQIIGSSPEILVRLRGDKITIRPIAGTRPRGYNSKKDLFYKKQLLAALEILEKNYANSDLLLGSWAGAMGQVQFLPTTYLESAVDFNNDGKKDIWNTKIDVFASIANSKSTFFNS